MIRVKVTRAAGVDYAGDHLQGTHHKAGAEIAIPTRLAIKWRRLGFCEWLEDLGASEVELGLPSTFRGSGQVEGETPEAKTGRGKAAVK